jgi:ABC-2 type transport system ATP-binding protein
MITVRNLTRFYDTFPAVDDVSFEVGKGQIWGLLGPNGAGKTTLMKILTGYHFPSEGLAEIQGMDIVHKTTEVQALVGYLPEMAPLYKEMTVQEYLGFIADVRGISEYDRRTIIENTAKECGVFEVLGKGIATLSKGYRQRVGLAQAILHDPDILILDEPTTGLDPNQILEFRELIKRIGASKTVILSTHILQEVEAICDHLMIMNQGKILASGPIGEVSRSLQGDAVYHLRLSGGNKASYLKKLSALPGLLGEPEVAREEPLEISVALDSQNDPGEVIFDWAVSQGYKLLALVPVKYSLQELFTRLTKEQ